MLANTLARQAQRLSSTAVLHARYLSSKPRCSSCLLCVLLFIKTYLIKHNFSFFSARSKHTLPDLPYDFNALEPVISAEIMQLHHSESCL